MCSKDTSACGFSMIQMRYTVFLLTLFPFVSPLAQPDLPIRQFEVHPSRYEYLVFSPDGAKLLTRSVHLQGCADSNDTATCQYIAFTILWDVSTGQMLRELHSHRYEDGEGYPRHPYPPLFSPDGLQFASSERDGLIRIWDVATGQVLRETPGLGAGMLFSPNGAYVAFHAGTQVRLWDWATRRVRFFRHGSNVISTAFTPSGIYLMSVSDDGIRRLWDLATGRVVQQTSNPDAIGDIKFSPDGTYLATQVGNSEIILSDAVTGREVWRTKPFGEEEYVEDWAFSPGGIYLVTQVRTDRTPPFFSLIDVTTGLEVTQFRRDWNTAAGCCWDRSWFGFSTDDTYFFELIESSFDGDHVRVWDIATGQTIYTITADGPLAMSKDGRFFALIRVDQEDEPVRLWASPSLTLQFEEDITSQSYLLGRPITPLVLPNAIGGIPPVYYTLTPELLADLQYDTPTKTISGIPTVVTSDPVEYTYTAASINGQAASLTFEISVSEPTFTETATFLPETFTVVGNYPNPFKDATQLVFDLPWFAHVRAEIIDMTGRRVLTVPENSLEAGWHRQMKIDGTSLPSGIYLYRLIANSPIGILVRTGRFVKAR